MMVALFVTLRMTLSVKAITRETTERPQFER